MQNPNTRKLIMIVFLTLAALVLLNGARIYITAKQPVRASFDAVNDFAYSGNRAQGNFVLYSEDNGFKTLPLIWGGRLFLYDVENNKSYPIKISAGYNGTFGEDLSMLGNNVYYSCADFTGGWGPPEVLNLRNLEADDPFRDLGGLGDSYIVTSEYIYGVDNYQGVYMVPIGSQERNYLFDGEGYYEIDLCGDAILSYNEIGSFIMEKSFQGGTINKYPTPSKHYVLKIVKNEPDYLIYINKEAGTIERYDKHDGATKTIVQFQEGVPYGEYYICDTFKIEGDYLYINDVNFNVLMVNLTNGNITKLIDQSKSIYDIESASISYCTDYIVIETIKTALFRTKTLSVYDYSGELIRKKHLKVRV